MRPAAGPTAGPGYALAVPLKMRQNQPEILQDVTCCYCHTPLVDVASDKEHVIAPRVRADWDTREELEPDRAGLQALQQPEV